MPWRNLRLTLRGVAGSEIYKTENKERLKQRIENHLQMSACYPVSGNYCPPSFYDKQSDASFLFCIFACCGFCPVRINQ